MKKRSLAALLAFSLVFSTVLPAAATDTAESTGDVAAEVQEMQVSDPAGDMIVDEEISDEASAEEQTADIAAEPQLVIEDSEVVDTPALTAVGDYDLIVFADMEREELLPGETVTYTTELDIDTPDDDGIVSANEYILDVELASEDANGESIDPTTIVDMKVDQNKKTVAVTAKQTGSVHIKIKALVDGSEVDYGEKDIRVQDGYYEISVNDAEVPLGDTIDWDALNPQLLYVTKDGRKPETEGFRWHVEYSADDWENMEQESGTDLPKLKRSTHRLTTIDLWAGRPTDEDDDELAWKRIIFDEINYNASLTAKYGQDGTYYVYTDQPQVFTLDMSGLPEGADYRIDWRVEETDENGQPLDQPESIKVVGDPTNQPSITLEALKGITDGSAVLYVNIYSGEDLIRSLAESLLVEEVRYDFPYEDYEGSYAVNDGCVFEKFGGKEGVDLYVHDSKHPDGNFVSAEIVKIEFGTPGIVEDVQNDEVRLLRGVKKGSTVVTVTLKNEELWGDETRSYDFTMTITEEAYQFFIESSDEVLFPDEEVHLKTQMNVTLSEPPYYREIPESDYKVSYTSSDPDVIEILENGNLKTKQPGYSTITATATIDGVTVGTDSRDFYVDDNYNEIEGFENIFELMESGNEFTLNPVLKNYSKEHRDGLVVEQGITYELSQTPEILEINGMTVKVPEDAEGKMVKLRIDVFQNGDQILARSWETRIRSGHKHTWDSGTVTTPATVFADAVKTCKCTYPGCTKTEQVSVPGTRLKATVTLTATSLTMKKKQSTKKLVASGFALGDSLASAVSSNTKVVKVTAVNARTGEIGLKAQNKTGKASLTIKLASGHTVTVGVKVQSAAVKTTKISGVPKKLTLKAKKSYTLKPVLKPITTQDKLKFTTSNKKVATVSKKGVIKAKKKGSATITVTCGKKKVKCKVKVTN